MVSYDEAPAPRAARRALARLAGAVLAALFLCAFLTARGAHPGAERLLEALILIARFEVPHTLQILLSALCSAGLFALLLRKGTGPIRGAWRRRLLNFFLALPCLWELFLHSVW